MKPGSDPQLAVNLQGHYAGAVTRLAAFAIDQAVATSVFALASAIATWALRLVTGGAITWDLSPWLTGLVFTTWLFIYYAYPWSVSGKTFGMALLGIRVVRADGAPSTPRNGVLRTLALPLSFVTLGLGFVPIITGRHRRALHDLIAGTAVVYSWDARAARLRFLAKHQGNDTTIADAAP